jgi:hypothetical protein
MDDNVLYFCLCAKQALKNAVKRYGYNDITKEDLWNFIFNPSSTFYLAFYLPDKNHTGNIDKVVFKDNICHVCNKQLPETSYFGYPFTAFSRCAGWYIVQRALEYGISGGIVILQSAVPDRLKKIMMGKKYYPSTERENEIRKRFIDGIDDLDTFFEKAVPEDKKEEMNRMPFIQASFFRKFFFMKDIEHEIENEIRAVFGREKFGEDWKFETSVFYKLKDAFPEVDVIHHGKPVWLGQQHLDVWIPEYNVAVEVQGEQHSKPMKHWDGKKGFEKQQARDKIKAEKCRENGTAYFIL